LAVRYRAALSNVDEIQTEDAMAKQSMSLYREEREVVSAKLQKGRVCSICGKSHILSSHVRIGDRYSQFMDNCKVDTETLGTIKAAQQPKLVNPLIVGVFF